MKCIFCNENEVVCENELAVAIFDKFPVSKGHCLIFTKRHVETYFQTTMEEKLAIMELVEEMKKRIDEEFQPDGYNIGCNCGAAAGQSIMHVHVHLIPRFVGDVQNPRGGVRGVIPNKQNY